MLHGLLQPLIILLLYTLVRSIDITITTAAGGQLVRPIAYGLVAALALVALFLLLH